MYVKNIDDCEEMKLWVVELNHSFENRSSKKIPYEEVTRDEIVIDSNNIVLGVYSEANTLIGGAYISYFMDINDVKIAKVGHVWIMTSCQKQGVGSFLMKEIENIALKDGRELLQLNVANIYLPAVHLYRKSGFKNLMIYANEPKTYYFIRMIKPIGDYKFAENRRVYKLIKSTVIFKILYKKDSSPTILNKMLYSR